MRPPQLIEHALRHALSGPMRQDVQQAVGWDNSSVSRFLNGDQGITIEKIDILVRAVGYILVTRKYLDAIAVLGEVGMSCECAREGRGECGRSLV